MRSIKRGGLLLSNKNGFRVKPGTTERPSSWVKPGTTEGPSSWLKPGTTEGPSSWIKKEFHYPVRQNMMTMLDQPVPDLPFAYTPDLIYFAYDPGVKGDLQRMWDAITPEFGWRTDNGTEFKCKWILIIAACGWK
jgi:hypothetical protein